MTIDNYVVLDTENSGAQRNKAHPHDPRNQMLLLGLRSGHRNYIADVDYSGYPYGSTLRDIATRISGAELLVGFNIKYDLHWLCRYNIPIGREVKIWDCQLAEFILESQKNSYPSLEESCLKHSVSLKKNILTNYLEKGLDVADIPLDELTSYLEGDLKSTEELFLKQIPLIEKAGLWNLMMLQMEDLKVLQEMEWNGIKYDLEKSIRLGEELKNQETEITNRLSGMVSAPFDINWNSGDHLSAILYGGTVTYIVKEPIGVYKTGIKAGQIRYRNLPTECRFERLVEPLKGSELAKEGYWSTAEDVLKELRPKGIAKEIIEFIQKQTKINKLRTTYYEGIPKKFEEFGWDDGMVHGQLNQCVARTGRLSSSNPNLQNNDKNVKECFVSRYEEI